MVAMSYHIGEDPILVHIGLEAEVNFYVALAMSHLQTGDMGSMQSFKDICCCHYNVKC